MRGAAGVGPRDRFCRRQAQKYVTSNRYKFTRISRKKVHNTHNHIILFVLI
jgi:hypothetical protein